jgi:exopolyphosphatase/guanosine-5'-triphosphate,3'-diphosphate pyrophosphatase
MPDRNVAVGAGRIAVVDVGSNSLRLVVFERLGGTLLPLLNEKVMCGLGRGIAVTGRLNREGMELAFANLERFVALTRSLGVDHFAVIATAAVREASDGARFAAEIERRCGVAVRIVDGAEEAQLSAAGVLAGIRDAEGVVGDLGGGSVELVPVSASGTMAGHETIGAGITLPLGPLRLAEFGDNLRAIAEIVDREVARADLLRAAEGRTLYLVGGAWRAIARLHMDQHHYPLHIIHEYTLSRRQAESFVELIGRLSRRSFERITTVNRRRLEVVPLAGLILGRLIAVGRPQRIVFSAFGLREGYAYALIPREGRDADPLIAACIAIATSQHRVLTDGDRLQQWTAPAFPALSPDDRRLHRAVCWLSNLAWAEHPDYRAEHAFTRSLRMPFAGLSHSDRVFVASALHARYGGGSDDPVKEATRSLLDERAAAEARNLGLALRLAYTLCGGALDLLSAVSLRRDGEGMELAMPPGDSRFGGEAIPRRLDALGRSLGLAARVRHDRSRRPVPA